MIRSLCCLALMGSILVSCAKQPSAVFDAVLPGGRTTQELATLIDDPLDEYEYVRIREIGRDDHASHHLITVRIGGVPHRHDHHDLTAVLVRGFGHMTLGDEEREVGTGSIIYIPRGVPHVFSNAADEPAVAYFVFTPPYDGKDRVVVGAVE